MFILSMFTVGILDLRKVEGPVKMNQEVTGLLL
jgi:hypothetical protein